MLVRKSYLCLIVVVMSAREIQCSSEIMKQMTGSFMKVLEECKKEINIGDSVLRDLYFYWKEDFTLIERDTGCAIVCMSHKLNLLDSSGKLHHGSAKEFAMSHGAAEDIATKLVTAIHDCEKQNEGQDDACLKALEVAKCFRKAIDELKWVPNMDVIITEVLTEI